MSDALPASLHLRVITPLKLAADTEVQEVQLPTLEGSIGIWPGHRPLYVTLGKGVLSFRCGDDHERFSVEGGFARVAADEVVVVTELREDEEEPARS
ncbi:MAG: hypothetical protein PHX45_00160 [Acidobacteriota bacterium]|nr:hypothetical protein [Acidobacteriota bacterium]